MISEMKWHAFYFSHNTLHVVHLEYKRVVPEDKLTWITDVCGILCVTWQQTHLYLFRSAVIDSKEKKEEKEQLRKRHNARDRIQWSLDTKKRSLERVTGIHLNRKTWNRFSKTRVSSRRKLCDCGCWFSHPLHFTFQLLPPPNPHLMVLQDILHMLLHEEFKGLGGV